MTKLSGKAKVAADAPAQAISEVKQPRAARAPAPRQATAPAATRGAVKASSASFVTVACKLPNGIYLQNYRMVDAPEPIQGGGSRMVKRAQPEGERVRINGTGRRPGQILRYPIVMGYALTKNVPIEHWERWLEANKDSAMVKNGLIFANPDGESLRDEAKEKRKTWSGLEPLDPKSDKRTPANKKKKLKIKMAEESSTPEDPDHDTENVEPDED